MCIYTFIVINTPSLHFEFSEFAQFLKCKGCYVVIGSDKFEQVQDFFEP